jgi:hypothetical protein
MARGSRGGRCEALTAGGAGTQEEEEIEIGEGDRITHRSWIQVAGAELVAGEQGRSSSPASRDGCSSPAGGELMSRARGVTARDTA